MSRKRGNGEGTIHRRKDGSWCTQYTVYTAEGRKRKTDRPPISVPATMRV
ncbi:MAG TPA: hypothetical protein VNA27_07195 [Rubrobacteraceae bacterium]|nr:hypothetical protein [Rubrobacteraceae bacterium]